MKSPITRFKDIPAAQPDRLQATVLAKHGAGTALKRACLKALLLHARQETRVAFITRRARILFTTDEAVNEWLSLPARSLDGRKPLDLLDTDDGAERVLCTLDGIIHGTVL